MPWSYLILASFENTKCRCQAHQNFLLAGRCCTACPMSKVWPYLCKVYCICLRKLHKIDTATIMPAALTMSMTDMFSTVLTVQTPQMLMLLRTTWQQRMMLHEGQMLKDGYRGLIRLFSDCRIPKLIEKGDKLSIPLTFLPQQVVPTELCFSDRCVRYSIDEHYFPMSVLLSCQK